MAGVEGVEGTGVVVVEVNRLLSKYKHILWHEISSLSGSASSWDFMRAMTCSRSWDMCCVQTASTESCEKICKSVSIPSRGAKVTVCVYSPLKEDRISFKRPLGCVLEPI